MRHKNRPFLLHGVASTRIGHLRAKIEVGRELGWGHVMAPVQLLNIYRLYSHNPADIYLNGTRCMYDAGQVHEKRFGNLCLCWFHS